MSKERMVFFVSDRTGITAETLGHGLLTQFPNIRFKERTIPFVDSEERAQNAVVQIDDYAKTSVEKPIVFITVVDPFIRNIVKQSAGFSFDYFETFMTPLEQELGSHSSLQVGLVHSISNDSSYKSRIEAVNYALRNDDGLNTRQYIDADIILVGVSRSGKTPTCLYMALQFGVYAANYPLTADDLQVTQLPKALKPFRKKIYGLTIDADRLKHIRTERKAGSVYASDEQCRWEVKAAEHLFEEENIPYISTTHRSVEEITTKIMHKTALKRHLY